MVNKELIIKILNEMNVGLYLRSRPLEKLPSSTGVLYKVNDVDVDSIIDAYNSHFESPEEE